MSELQQEQTTVENWVDQAKEIENGEAPSGKVIKLTGKDSVTSPAADQPTSTYQQQHAKVLRFEISVSKEDDATTIEQWETYLRAVIQEANDDSGRPFTFKNFVTSAGYYIIDGKVCMPQDYDPMTRNRKPGTFPPLWAGGPNEQERKSLLKSAQTAPAAIEVDEPEEQEFVAVRSSLPRRDPITGHRPRKPRSDKGSKKGARTESPDKVKSAIAQMGKELRETQ